MHINYIIQVHQNPEQLKRLILRLNTSNVFFYIHVDKKSNLIPFQKELNNFNNIYFFDDNSRINVIWGEISQVQATLLAMNKIIQDKRTGYCILMSGQDYPIKTNEYIFDFLEKNHGSNFIKGRPVEDVWKTYKQRIYNYNFSLNENQRHNTSIYIIYNKKFYSHANIQNMINLAQSKKRKYLYKVFIPRKTPKIKQYGGSQWWALPIETIYYILDFIKNNKSYLNYHQFTHVPDEIFFHSIVSNGFQDKEIKHSLTYVNWAAQNRPLPITFELDDYNELINNNFLFARKFYPESEILNMIDKKILHIN